MVGPKRLLYVALRWMTIVFVIMGVKGCVLSWVPTWVHVGVQGIAQGYFKVKPKMMLRPKVGQVRG